ncbi:MAG: hypothetical protein M3416_15465 [Acidobacteriota bacterium]|nr:hypothetical protein [Acidobacteriota bacterium]
MSPTLSAGRLIVMLAAMMLLPSSLSAEARDKSKGGEGDRRFAKFGAVRVHYRSLGKGAEALLSKIAKSGRGQAPPLQSCRRPSVARARPRTMTISGLLPSFSALG